MATSPTTTPLRPDPTPLRHDFGLEELESLLARPLLDLLFEAQLVHRAHFPANAVQLSQLLSIKTGGCSEDCGYCPQASRYDTGVEREQTLAVDEVLARAKAAKEGGASRFCMGAAWRSPKDHELQPVLEMVKGVKALGLEACATLGMLSEAQAGALKEAGLDYYNHNLDTSPEHYGEIITTRTYQDRLDTLSHVRGAGMHVCSGGIVGLGESRRDRAGLLQALANQPEHPESVPINLLVKVGGTPLAQVDDLDPFELVRTIAVARLIMPKSYVRLSAGREQMSDELHALCFMAGANSIFWGAKLLTTPNPSGDRDQRLFQRLGLSPLVPGA
ncbi:MAG: biotin synthase BioB [Deltaproteobacteria bacterium]|nr:biotin synthase BioB [Deltaproteobacteria bacterium]